MTKKSKWEKELEENNALENHCENILKEINLSKENKPIVKEICKEYGVANRKLPTREEILDIITPKIINKRIKGDKIKEEPFESIIPMWIVHPKQVKNFDKTDKKFKLNKVLFDTGGQFLMVDKTICDNLGLQQFDEYVIDKRILEDKQGEEHEYSDKVNNAFAGLCIETEDGKI